MNPPKLHLHMGLKDTICLPASRNTGIHLQLDDHVDIDDTGDVSEGRVRGVRAKNTHQVHPSNLSVAVMTNPYYLPNCF